MTATKRGEYDSEKRENNDKNNRKYNTDDGDDDAIVSMELHTPNET